MDQQLIKLIISYWETLQLKLVKSSKPSLNYIDTNIIFSLALV